MSMELWEYAQDEAMSEYYEKLYLEEFKERAIDEFTEERLRSYYIDHPNLIVNALSALSEAKKVESTSPTSSVLLAAISIELGFKIGVLKPIVFGFVHSEAAAEAISNTTIKQTGIDRFKSLLITLLTDISSVDISRFIRNGASKPLWDERNEIQKLRNEISHQGKICSLTESNLSIAVAESLFSELLPKILESIRLDVKTGVIVEQRS